MTSDVNSPAASRWRPLLASCLGTFLLLLYTSIVSVALPQIGADLHAGFSACAWIMDVFSLTLAGLLLGMGSLSDNLGRKRVYLAGLAAFTLATAGCGLAGSAALLIAARAAQGVAAAAMFATILPLIALTYSGRDRARAFAVYGAVAGSSSAIGAVTGGMLSQYLGWRWIFLGSLPICLATIWISCVALAETPRAHHRVDYLGVTTFTITAGAATYAVIRAGEAGWASPGTLMALAAAGASFLIFGWRQRRGDHPVLPAAMFSTRRFAGVLLAAFSYYLAAFSGQPVLSIWLQVEARLSPTATGLVLASQVGVFFVTSLAVSGRLHDVPAGRVLGGGSVLVGVGCLSALVVSGWTAWPAVLPALLITGAAAGAVSPVLPAVAIGSVPPAYGGTAGAAANGSRQLGLTMGIALCATAYARSGGGSAGLVSAFGLCAAVALVGGALAMWLLRTRCQPVGSTGEISATESAP
ncbi:MAG TPA: MFS transporter [Pseudonocardia sp.]|nr:MFS transporter [Pseudonocardia sp.]